MLDIDKIKNYHKLYLERKKALFENNTIKGFVSFIQEQEIANKKSGVVSLASRTLAQERKAMSERQKENEAFTPEEDFKNLK